VTQLRQNKEVHLARTPIHPGETLREDLEALSMSAAELSRQPTVPVNCITQILNGSRSITGDTALRLGHLFTTSPEFWLNLQKLNELRMAEQAKGDEVSRFPRFDATAWHRRGHAGETVLHP
jgi:addiction module HigA family antidote